MKLKQGTQNKLRLQVLIVASLKKTVFWVVAPCGVIEVYQCFRGAYHLIIRVMMEAARTSETWVNFYQTT
jgi:hypothetical protein